MDKRKKLTYLADDMLKKADQADALKKLGEENPEQASKIQNILSAFAPEGDIIKQKVDIDRFNKVVNLIKSNIENSKGYTNFSKKEYMQDKKKVIDIKLKHLSAYIPESKDDLITVNKIYKKHLNIQSILSSK
tara:strand:+ start:81 stop:479 length:399 start_codon:yes stop_codon:yes gene_type:complete